MQKIFSALILICFISILSITSARAESLSQTFRSTEDAYVQSDAQNTNYGGSTQMRVDGSPTVRSYLRFNVENLEGTVINATLRIYTNSTQNTGFSVHTTSDTWNETTINYNNAPAYTATPIGSSGSVIANNWYDIPVTSVVTTNGSYNFVLTTTSNTALSLASRESINDPELIIETETEPTEPTPTPDPTPSPDPTSTPTPAPVNNYIYSITNTDSIYTATNENSLPQYSGTSLKTVVSSAVNTLNSLGGGTISFSAGTFDYGTEWLVVFRKSNIIFEGQGIDVTFIQNSTNVASDTEPFSFGKSDHMTVRNLTVSAGGSPRSSSDAIDFDAANDTLVENVKVVASRGRGIVFDGKDLDATAERNVIRNCIISGTAGSGIELLASSNNLIENCTITNAGVHGIHINKSSNQAVQPNKPSNNNIVKDNIIDNSGQHGLSINSSNENLLINNTVTNSSNLQANKDGIRIGSVDGFSCNLNRIELNTASDNQASPTQTYGLHIYNPTCVGTIVTGNTFIGNKTGTIRDLGSGTIYQ